MFINSQLCCNFRVFVVAVVAVSIAWIPIIQNISELFHYIQGITSFLAPPVCAVYVLAVSWKRINEHVSLTNNSAIISIISPLLAKIQFPRDGSSRIASRKVVTPTTGCHVILQYFCSAICFHRNINIWLSLVCNYVV